MDDETAVALARLALEAGMVRHWKPQAIVTKDSAHGTWRRRENGVWREVLLLRSNPDPARVGELVWFDFSEKAPRTIKFNGPAEVAVAMLLLKVWGEEYKGSNNHDRD